MARAQPRIKISPVAMERHGIKPDVWKQRLPHKLGLRWTVYHGDLIHGYVIFYRQAQWYMAPIIRAAITNWLTGIATAFDRSVQLNPWPVDYMDDIFRINNAKL